MCVECVCGCATVCLFKNVYRINISGWKALYDANPILLRIG